MGEKKDGDKPKSDKYKTVTATAYAAPAKDGIPELAGHVYIVGPGQADMFRKTTDAIAEYVGRVMMDEMYDLVYNGKEATFTEPADLSEDDAKGTKLEKYKIQLKMVLDEEKKYKSDKARVFRLIVGQCVPLMKNKLENEPTFKTLEAGKDVIGLTKLMKTLVYSTADHQYEFWTMQASLTTLLTLKQHEKEGVASFGKKFLAQLEATELVWGKLIPSKYSGGTDIEQAVAMNKFLACAFLAGLDRVRYKQVIDELNNDFLLGTTSFPEDLSGMLTLISNYRGVRISNPKAEAMLDGVAFAQGGPATCFRCGSNKHKKSDCPRRKKNNIDNESGEGEVLAMAQDDLEERERIAWYAD